MSGRSFAVAAGADRTPRRDVGHSPAVGSSLDHRCAPPVSGGGPVLQRPVQLERKVRMEPINEIYHRLLNNYTEITRLKYI